jgi:Spy/CpxP family protein refolding chaperone
VVGFIKKRRKKMKKLVLFALVVLMVMGLAVNSGAVEKAKSDGQCSGMHMMHGDDGGCGCSGASSPFAMFKKLGLDDKQKEAVREIRLSTKKEIIKKKADVELAKIELREILTKDSVDLAAAEAAVKKVESLKADIKILLIKSGEEIKSKLNAEQKKQFTEIVHHMMMRHEMMRHKMMGNCECSMHGKHTMHEKGKKKSEEK